MHKWIPAIMLILFLPGFMFGEDQVQSFTDRVTGGVLCKTNSTWNVNSESRGTPSGSASRAFELKHIAFTLPSAALTNTFTFRHIRTYKLPDVKTEIVTTNAVTFLGGTASITTQTFWYAQGAVTITNDHTIAVTTNDATLQVYDTDDFPKGLVVEPYDIEEFRFTETNAFDLIRVYDVYPR